jgi:adenylyltransferase/sulfurtransferase
VNLPVEVLAWQVGTTQAGDLLERVRSDLGSDAVIEFGRDLLASLHCSICCEDEPMFASLGKVTESEGRCPRCGQPRAPIMFHSLNGNDRDLLEMTLSELGVPPWDVLGGRTGLTERFYEFRGDSSFVLGALQGRS